MCPGKSIHLLAYAQSPGQALEAYPMESLKFSEVYAGLR